MLGSHRIGIATRAGADDLAAVGPRSLSAARGNRRAAEIRLYVSEAATGAWRAVQTHDHVSDLAPETPGSPIWLSVEEQRATNTGSKCDHHAVADTLRSTEPCLADPGAVAIVVEGDVLADARHDERPHVETGQREVRTELDRLLEEVDLGRKPDTDTRDFRGVRAGDRLGDELYDSVDDSERAILGSEIFRLFHETTLALDQAHRDTRASDIHSNGVRCSHCPSRTR